MNLPIPMAATLLTGDLYQSTELISKLCTLPSRCFSEEQNYQETCTHNIKSLLAFSYCSTPQLLSEQFPMRKQATPALSKVTLTLSFPSSVLLQKQYTSFLNTTIHPLLPQIELNIVLKQH